VKYVPVEELDRSKITVDNFEVEDPDGERFGTLRG
jgi:hypothetical protein